MHEPKLGGWISFSKDQKLKQQAVVCHIYDSENIEVVYLDERNRAINEDMKLIDGKWEFKISGPCGGYADNRSRLREYVGILRQK
jgi:hypothetical protein